MKSFSNLTVHLVSPKDERLVALWDDSKAGYEQTGDGPIFVVIGRFASNAGCRHYAARFGFKYKRVIRFRNRAAARGQR